MLKSNALWLIVWAFSHPFTFLLPDYLHAYEPGTPIKEFRSHKKDEVRSPHDIRLQIKEPHADLSAAWLCFELKRPNRLHKLVLVFNDERRISHWTGIYWGQGNRNSGPWQYEWSATHAKVTAMRASVEERYIVIAFELAD